MIFLGHILSADGISVNPGMVDKVRDWPVPKNTKELHSFPGAACYYWQFIPNFAHVTKSLYQLISLINVKKSKGKKKDVTHYSQMNKTKKSCGWMSEHQIAFDTLKTAFITALVLG